VWWVVGGADGPAHAVHVLIYLHVCTAPSTQCAWLCVGVLDVCEQLREKKPETVDTHTPHLAMRTDAHTRVCCLDLSDPAS
jgi:hypothetical protein